MSLRRIETVISAVVGCLALAACNRPSSSPPAKETAPTTTARPPADEPLPPRDPGTPEVDEPSQPPDAGIYLGTINDSKKGGYAFWVGPSIQDPNVRQYLGG